jgi:hypothetical protein
MNLNIHQELFSQFLNLIKAPLAVLANPAALFFFILLPAFIFIIVVRVIKPQKLFIRLSLPFMLCFLMGFIGMLLINQVRGGFFSLMAIASILFLMIISLSILFPFCGGVVLRGNEKYYTLIYPIAIYILLLSGYEKNSWDFVQNATVAITILPIAHFVAFFLGSSVRKIVLPAYGQDYNIPLKKARGPLAVLVLFVLLWCSLFYLVAGRISASVHYGDKSDAEVQELSLLAPHGLLIYNAASNGDMRVWNAAYREGVSPYEVRKFNFTTGNYELLKTLKVDIRQEVGDDSGTISPEGDKVAKFQNGGDIAVYGENGLFERYPTGMKVDSWIQNIISWAPDGSKFLIYVCTQGANAECKDYSLVILGKGVQKLSMNLKEVRWINEGQIIGMEKDSKKIGVYNVSDEKFTYLPDTFFRYQIVLPSPDMKVFAAITANGQ